MLEVWVPWMLIFNEYGGLWNRLRRLVETDSPFRIVMNSALFNIIYIMRNVVLRNQGQCPSDFNRQNPYLTQT